VTENPDMMDEAATLELLLDDDVELVNEIRLKPVGSRVVYF